MSKLLVIAVRDYKAAVHSKSFLIGLLLMPAIWVGSGVIQHLIKQRQDTETKRIAVVDRTPKQVIVTPLQALAEDRNAKLVDRQTGRQVGARFELVSVPPSQITPEAVNQQRLQLSEQVQRGEYYGFLEIGPDVAKTSELGQAVDRSRVYLRYQTSHPTYRAFTEWAKDHLNLTIQVKRWEDAGLPVDKINALVQFVELTTTGLSNRDEKTGNVQDPPPIHQIARTLVPIGLVLLMFMVVMIGATPAMHGILEEKTQRIAEVLLGSVQPFQLMLGKLLGLLGVSLTIALVYLGGAYYSAHHYGFTEYLPLDLLAWFLVFQVLALMMYGSLFLAVGSAATDIKETQTLLLPIALTLCLPLMALGLVLEDPNNSFVIGASFFPFVTPMLMLARLAIPPGIPWWQPLLGILDVLAMTALCVYVAGRIFRVGILMQGKGAKFSDLLRWVFTG